jgi:hypothetical protein
LFDTDLNFLSSISLEHPESVIPTAFVVTETSLIVTDHARQLIVAYDRSGNLIHSFGTMPDGQPLSPFAVTAHGGVAYVGDMNSGRVLAVSLTDTEGVTEFGELILTIPSDSLQTLSVPSAAMVTLDGRLLVGEGGTGMLRAFTCDGRHVYDFENLTLAAPVAPQAFAMDDLIDPSLQDTATFDPSGVRSLGRIHITDSNNGKIHVFNPVGTHVLSYPSETRLQRPSGIAIDWTDNRIFIADPAAGRLLEFKYRGN